ncbi:MBL fold hydrolase [Candidatus Uhrbacteria bacterium CG22_combo_CG10-13_8_21_14_all_47_17]|uniref:MBL fold hydrolase n=1 Tax=Candidatus Uhrbacteria bacterium CG22_combo_CG10-13_8_21_14_all_47_17 TaxID=1975041 RepID=A0A2H0BTC6_9BACT|nr:MAG: MBL fold hydrolase [Candidatus Uhrbacteria bacterium CG22_combo_CG10-13_8_21_14_all_47_17]
MKITFFGATREVTGSCNLLEGKQTRILVDCGMFQGCNLCDVKNFVTFPFDPSTVDALIITHAHLDHVGRIPKLVKEGFRGKIYATPPTVELAKIVLQDAFHIMKEDNEREQRPLLYEEKDIDLAFENFVPLDYSHDLEVGEFTIRLRDAGHIFGSSFVEIHSSNGKSVAFSGDLGNDGARVLRQTAQLSAVDTLVIESTYGNRIHEDESARASKLKEIILRTVKHKGVLVIPAFAIERTQQILYEMNAMVEHGVLPPIDTYLDSPMAIKATRVMKKYPQYYDAEALRTISTGDDLFDFPGLRLTETRSESILINDAPQPKIIIAGSGMMNGGRIQHHLRRYLSSKNNSLLIIGYQAEGTLGHDLYEGKKVVTVLRDRIHVKAHVESIGAYSAHADQRKLLRWVETAQAKPKQIYCTHGDEGAAVALATNFKEQLDIPAEAPKFGQTVEL